MEKKSFYKEELYFCNDFSQDKQHIEQDKILQLLSKNMAVGVACGVYDKNFTTICISDFMLNNLGYTFEDFERRTNGSYIAIVHPDDKGIFAAHARTDGMTQREYRMIAKNGGTVWVNEIREDTVNDAGERVWMCSVRVVEELHRVDMLNEQIMRSLGSIYLGIWRINLRTGSVYCLKCPDGADHSNEELNSAQWLERALPLYYEDDTERLLHFLSRDNLRSEYENGASFSEKDFRRRIGGKYLWVCNSVVFDKGTDGSDTAVLTQRDVTSRHFQNELLSALSRDYLTIIHLNLFTDRYNIIRRSAEFDNAHESGSVDDFGNVMSDYIKKIHPDDADVIGLLNDRNAAIARLETCEKGEYVVLYRRLAGKDWEWMQLKIMFSGSPLPDKSHIIFAFRNVDEAVRKELDSKQLLSEALGQAEKANLAKRDFLSKMSHDIRTPLNAIIGMTTLAAAENDVGEKAQGYLAKASEACGTLMLMLNEVLDMNDIENGSMKLAQEQFSLTKLLRGSESLIMPALVKKRQTLYTNISAIKHDIVIGDTLRLHQIFGNILSNASKYSAEGSCIEVTATELPQLRKHFAHYSFSFTDHGIGMDKSVYERIFEPFERVEDPRTSKEPQVGLGLSITKNLVDLMKGEITVESELDKGSTFTVTLELKLPYDDETDENLDIDGMRILYAEDNELNREIARELLAKENAIVETAENGAEAVKMFSEHECGYYDAILMDIQMPVMNGYEATEKIRAMTDKNGDTIPIITLTADVFTEDVRLALRHGMDRHLAKPLDFKQVKNTLAKLRGDNNQTE